MIPYNVLSDDDEFSWEEEQELAAYYEQEGELLDYLTDEDFSKLDGAEQERIIRLEQLKALQEHYANFDLFLSDVMYELGFKLTKIQASIGRFMCDGPQYLMVEAQRSQAKTTIAAAFCVWTLIHDPKKRILIISAGGSQAADISTLIIRLIMNMDVLECLRPDKAKGDRVSVEKFDLHYSLRRLEKSASVSCCGITANLQGRRADLLLADDIESQKNSLTQLMREQLLAKTLDFTSINQNGRILYLGTPQSSDSIYNTLPARGYEVRIWPGRFPTADQIEYYGEHLAPDLRAIMEQYPEVMTGGGRDGDQGRPIEPKFLGEEILQKKEKDQGPAWFQLQHMLNTRAMDAERFPLKTENIMTMPMRLGDELPTVIKRGYDYVEYSIEGKNYRFCKPHSTTGANLSAPDGICFYIDPAGGGKGKGTHGGDETGWACVAQLNGYLYALGWGGVKGGYDTLQMQELAKLVVQFRPSVVKIEKNFGYGAFAVVFMPILRAMYSDCAVEEDMVHGQKEIRIIDTLEPIIARGALIFNENYIKKETSSLTKHPEVNRVTYCMFQQINYICRERDALVHDDRLDALEGACRHFQMQLAVDHEKRQQEAAEVELKAFWKDPLNHNRYKTPGYGANQSLLSIRRHRL